MRQVLLFLVCSIVLLVFLSIGCGEGKEKGQIPTPSPTPLPTAIATPSPTPSLTPAPTPTPAISAVRSLPSWPEIEETLNFLVSYGQIIVIEVWPNQARERAEEEWESGILVFQALEYEGYKQPFTGFTIAWDSEGTAYQIPYEITITYAEAEIVPKVKLPPGKGGIIATAPLALVEIKVIGEAQTYWVWGEATLEHTVPH